MVGVHFKLQKSLHHPMQQMYGLTFLINKNKKDHFFKMMIDITLVLFFLQIQQRFYLISRVFFSSSSPEHFVQISNNNDVIYFSMIYNPKIHLLKLLSFYKRREEEQYFIPCSVADRAGSKFPGRIRIMRDPNYFVGFVSDRIRIIFLLV